MMPVSPLSKRIGTETSMQFTIMGYERELKWEKSASGQEIGSDRKRGIKKVSFTPKHGAYRRERKRQASMISLREEGEKVSPEAFHKTWFHFSPTNAAIGKDDGRRRAHPEDKTKESE